MSAIPNDNKSLGQLFGDLLTETRTLVRQEIALAKTEMSDKAAYAGKHAGVAGAGALVILLGALAIVAGLIIALGHKIGYATSAFMIGVLFAILGAVLVMKALNALKTQSIAPQQTADQLKETNQWAKDQIR
jgi:Putative Actinobacterial Holin-X, holin superfamily III